MSDQNWVVPTDALEFFSQQNRRIGQEERRPSVRKASDLLGPGIAPYAVPLTDFNSDMAAFNGLFIAEPSTPYANNGPDNTKWWVGQTVADQFNGGWQMFSTFQPGDLVGARHTIMVRSFSLAPDSNARFYSDWQPLGGAPPSVARAVASGALGNTNASGFVTVPFNPPLPFTPIAMLADASNSQLKASVDMPNSSNLSARVYFRHITVAGSPVYANTNPGFFALVAFS